MRCSFSCRPHNPCHHAGCPNVVQIGVGNEAGRDMDLQATGNSIRGGGRVRLGTDNYAGRDSEMQLNRNRVWGDHGSDVQMGVGNTAGRDSRIVISDNDVGYY